MNPIVAQDVGPKYEAEAPQHIPTPDTVETKLLGKLEFFEGMPSKATVKKCYDFIDFIRTKKLRYLVPFL